MFRFFPQREFSINVSLKPDDVKAVLSEKIPKPVGTISTVAGPFDGRLTLTDDGFRLSFRFRKLWFWSRSGIRTILYGRLIATSFGTRIGVRAILANYSKVAFVVWSGLTLFMSIYIDIFSAKIPLVEFARDVLVSLVAGVVLYIGSLGVFYSQAGESEKSLKMILENYTIVQSVQCTPVPSE